MPPKALLTLATQINEPELFPSRLHQLADRLVRRLVLHDGEAGVDGRLFKGIRSCKAAVKEHQRHCAEQPGGDGTFGSHGVGTLAETRAQGSDLGCLVVDVGSSYLATVAITKTRT